MGGSYYERAIETTTSSTGSSNASRVALSARSVHADADPKSGNVLTTISDDPVIIAFDVTGSMGDWPRVIYDKIPMLYGQVMSNGYLSDPSLSFMAVGDRNATLQATPFAQAMDIDTELKKVWLAGQGRGSPENYEFAAYFLAKQTDFKAAANKPFFFLIGDAKYFPQMASSEVVRVFGHGLENDAKEIDSKQLWQEVMQKTNMFYLHKFYSNASQNQSSVDQWNDTLGPGRMMFLDNPKACADAILGIISIVSGAHTLESYMEDMVTRGQDDARCVMIRKALVDVSDAMDAAREGRAVDDALA